MYKILENICYIEQSDASIVKHIPTGSHFYAVDM